MERFGSTPSSFHHTASLNALRSSLMKVVQLTCSHREDYFFVGAFALRKAGRTMERLRNLLHHQTSRDDVLVLDCHRHHLTQFGLARNYD